MEIKKIRKTGGWDGQSEGQAFSVRLEGRLACGVRIKTIIVVAVWGERPLTIECMGADGEPVDPSYWDEIQEALFAHPEGQRLMLAFEREWEAADGSPRIE